MGTYAEKGQEADDLIAAQASQLESYGSEIASLEAALATEEAKTEAVEKAFAEHMKTHDITPPAPKKAKIGSSTNQAIPGYTKVDVARVYLQPGDKPKTYLDPAANFGSDVAKLNQGGCLWFSAKDAPDTWLDGFLASTRKLYDDQGITTEYTQNHEFDNDGPNSSVPVGAQLAEYHRRWDVVAQIVKNHPHVKTSPLLLGHRTEKDWVTVVPHTYDHMGFDVYNAGIGTNKRYVPVPELCDKLVDFAKKNGKPLVIGETGTGTVPGDAPGRVKWAADLRAYFLDPKNNVLLACWWNQAQVTFDAPTAKAFLG